ncbi:phosphoribosylaminoimidazolesuccinocarboxamide synthase [Thermoanaerobacterium thermosaccharolyticum]|jgi:phosphoribosylaminoimidazole-succinocarboxamide synthase|uniref:Phosphoribosylaminoimidazole-succinocarboxamide synthase n=3 Tax=Thermoanaerobacterium thermosaccharolyticum TaxID=1517 RepID=D9TR93_THETC|nr:phosphoribosylaminoimidazolesuccinocarboxamide synthase [Thermoanaerobacterium thermosaccharolyticum]TCW42137.1 phosphoribosylaminoimidazole-succinocarboxamide synthase [Thermohydrogenium kirishiense]ADL69591.1 phosphoribosylaminoimidazole-succinocarboxamide synthase [Thermoanaerobacterium thermosaccharolyticum DSM 571]AGB19766.1 phosphoribosylaminoimidazole-succinocarboxamide synthase [Thermoanaerobacterium thermosaccharolyticum M0795]AST56749.1 phosphoribosylaminoimidazole-succinocarboxami
MEKLSMLYEGKAKKVFRTSDEDFYIIEYKDDATAFNGIKKGTIQNKGILNNEISTILFELLEKEGVPTHFVKRLNDREMLVKKVEIYPIEVLIRNYAAGSISKRLGIEEGAKLKRTVLEFCYKNDELGDPFINEYHIEAMELATKDEVETIKNYSFKINDILSKYFISKNIILVDFKLEFGKSKDGIVLADEISPDTCRFWDSVTMEKLDKDRFRRDLGNVEGAYVEVLNRLEKQ